MQIRSRTNQTILSITEFRGLNENPDGNTALEVGEFSELRNFRITQDKHLQLRPGCQTVAELGTGTVYGVWHGYVNGAEKTLVACGGSVFDVDVEAGSARNIGTAAAAETSFFGFGNKVYLLNGTDYMSWDGGDETGFETVAGYVPLVRISTTPGGSGADLERVNRLTNQRRVQFSPDGSSTSFVLPEDGISSIVKVTLGGAETTAYTANLQTGVVTMNSAPAVGTNTLEVTYSKGTAARADVTGMKFAEFFNGSTDTRVFLYGDGSNRAVYSGITYGSGQASAEYFPTLGEIAVGDSNTPITSLIRHYSRMMAFKPGSAWVVSYGTLDLADSSTAAAFYVQPVNRQFGNESPGQVQLLENDPLTLDSGSIFQWRSGGYSSYITDNENNAKRISNRVEKTLRQYTLANVKTANIKSQHEYWFLPGDGRALILNYDCDAWYFYDGLPVSRVFEIDTEVYGVGDDGAVRRISRDYRNDDGEEIDAYAATGAMDLKADWLMKYAPMMFVAMQPESGARVTVTAESNRKSDYPEKVVSYGLATFTHMDFNHFSFGTNRKPQTKRVKIKVKKATFYRIVYKSRSASATSTIIQTDIKLRYAGNVK